jgi:hypothetical protein
MLVKYVMQKFRTNIRGGRGWNVGCLMTLYKEHMLLRAEWNEKIIMYGGNYFEEGKCFGPLKGLAWNLPARIG